MTKLDWDFFGAYIFALIVLAGLIAAGIAYELPILVFLAVLSAGLGWLAAVASIWLEYFPADRKAQARAVILISTFASDGAAVLGMTILMFRVML